MPARFPFARRARPATPATPVAGPVSARLPSPSPEVSPPRPAARWTVAPDGPDDKRLYRHQPSRAAGPGALERPAIRAASLAASPLPASAPAAGRGRGDFSGVPAHRTGSSADPRQVPAAAHVERALLSPYARPPAGAFEAARRANVTRPEQIRVHHGPAAQLATVAVGARAFTVGPHIVMGPSAGPDVLEHELVHAAQQSGAAMTTDGMLPAELPVTSDDSAFEHAARAGIGAGSSLRADRPALQRDADPGADQHVYTLTLSLPPLPPEHYDQLNAHDAGVALRNFTRRVGSVIAGSQDEQKYLEQLHEDQWIVANISDVLGGFISLPPLSIWDPVDASLSSARQHLADGDVMEAASQLQNAANQARAAAAKVRAYREGTEAGAERTIFGLQIVQGTAAAVITAGTGGTAGVLLGAGYAGLQKVAGQATAVHLGLQQHIDWAGIGFDTLLGAAMGFAAGPLSKLIAGRMLGQLVAKEAGAIATPMLQRIVAQVAKDVVAGRVGAVIQNAARMVFDQARGKETLTVEEFMKRLADVLTDPKGIFADAINGKVTHGIQTLAARSASATPPSPRSQPPSRSAPVTEPIPPTPATKAAEPIAAAPPAPAPAPPAPVTEPAPAPASPVTEPAPAPPARVTEPMTTPPAPLTEAVTTTPPAPVTQPTPPTPAALVPEPATPPLAPATDPVATAPAPSAEPPTPSAPVTEPVPAASPAPAPAPAVPEQATAAEPAAPAAQGPAASQGPAPTGTAQGASAGIWSELAAQAEIPTRRQADGTFRTTSVRSGAYELAIVEGTVSDPVSEAERISQYVETLPGEHATHPIGMLSGENTASEASAPPRYNLTNMRRVENAIRGAADRAKAHGASVETRTEFQIEHRQVGGKDVKVIVGVRRQAWLRFPASAAEFQFVDVEDRIDPVTRQVAPVRPPKIIVPRK
jgi:hypothetical protein